MEFRLYRARFKQFHSPWASIGDVFTANSWVPHLVIIHESSRQDKAYHGSSSYRPRLKNVCAYVPGERDWLCQSCLATQYSDPDLVIGSPAG